MHFAESDCVVMNSYNVIVHIWRQNESQSDISVFVFSCVYTTGAFTIYPPLLSINMSGVHPCGAKQRFNH